MPEAHHDASPEDDRVAYLEEIVGRQREQLSQALFILAELGFDLNEWMDAIA